MTPSPTGEKLSGRQFSTDDIPFLDLRSAASLARADTASLLPSGLRMPSGATVNLLERRFCCVLDWKGRGLMLLRIRRLSTDSVIWPYRVQRSMR